MDKIFKEFLCDDLLRTRHTTEVENEALLQTEDTKTEYNVVSQPWLMGLRFGVGFVNVILERVMIMFQ
jgi:hypothetical protein